MEKKKILIADDDADLVLATRLVLESAGYELVSRHDFIEKQHFLIFVPGPSIAARLAG
mgnify:CR=1 FL=1